MLETLEDDKTSRSIARINGLKTYSIGNPKMPKILKIPDLMKRTN